MKIVVTIYTGNDAFFDEASPGGVNLQEVGRVLSVQAGHFRMVRQSDLLCGWYIHDINGNVCGSVKLESEHSDPKEDKR